MRAPERDGVQRQLFIEQSECLLHELDHRGVSSGHVAQRATNLISFLRIHRWSRKVVSCETKVVSQLCDPRGGDPAEGGEDAEMPQNCHASVGVAPNAERAHVNQRGVVMSGSARRLDKLTTGTSRTPADQRSQRVVTHYSKAIYEICSDGRKS